jgi:DHA2 family multidrug resistance protein-like MFS transporter
MAEAATLNPADGLPTRQRQMSLLTLGVGLAMSVIDAAMINVALPTVARDLQVTAAESIWVVNAYQISLMVSLLPFASLGDIYGYGRVFRTGLVVFTLASIACSLSTSLPMLTAARVIEGLGGAGMMSVNMALVRFSYPRAQLGRAVGFTAMIVASCSALGPTVASVVLTVAPWRALFLVGVPFGIMVFMISGRALPRMPPSQHRFDVASAVLSALTFGLLVIGVDGIGHGHGPVVVAIEFAAAIIFGVLLVRRQQGLAYPILPVDLFRRLPFSLAILTSMCSFGAQTITMVTLPFFLQDVAGRSQVETGILMTPWPVTVAVMAFIAGRLADKHPASILASIGLGTMFVGLIALAMLPDDASNVDVIWRMVLCGIGFGFFQTPNNRAIVGATPPERTGNIGGLMGTTRQLGNALGAASVALMFALSGGPHGGTAAAIGLAAALAAIGGAASSMRLFKRD